MNKTPIYSANFKCTEIRFGELFGSSWSRQKCAFICLPCKLWIQLCDSHINDERNL